MRHQTAKKHMMRETCKGIGYKPRREGETMNEQSKECAKAEAEYEQAVMEHGVAKEAAEFWSKKVEAALKKLRDVHEACPGLPKEVNNARESARHLARFYSAPVGRAGAVCVVG